MCGLSTFLLLNKFSLDATTRAWPANDQLLLLLPLVIRYEMPELPLKSLYLDLFSRLQVANDLFVDKIEQGLASLCQSD